MKILETLKQRQAAEHEANLAKYHALIVRAAAAPEGSLEAPDEKRLANLVDVLGFSFERVEADLSVAREHHQLAPLAAEVPARRKATEEAEAAAKSFDAETAAMVKEREARSWDLWQSHRTLAAAADKASRAADRVAELRKDHWRLLDAEAPDIAARRRHLVAARRRSVSRWSATSDAASTT